MLEVRAGIGSGAYLSCAADTNALAHAEVLEGHVRQVGASPVVALQAERSVRGGNAAEQRSSAMGSHMRECVSTTADDNAFRLHQTEFLVHLAR